MAHAAAQDAVQEQLNVDALTKSLAIPAFVVHSRAADRETYLHRPDLGRQLDDDSRAKLEATADAADLSIIIADGLSARAVESHAPPLLQTLLPALRSKAISIAPIVIALQARVAIQDEIGQLLHCKSSLILLGERPGLSSPDSLGAYLVFDPKPGNTDAQRNCVSNIRPQGLAIPAAANLLGYLINESIHRKLSGVRLKDERSVPEIYCSDASIALNS
jgi:ethanolamine ammonia-lyase small subunit